jgi:GNAT superfamily N-acetyltransferase
MEPSVMSVRIEGPLTSLADLPALEPLWVTLHAHHQGVASYRPLVSDVAASWDRRRTRYAKLLADEGALFVARDDQGQPVGYAMTQTEFGADDTFKVVGGIVELVSLVVGEAARGKGTGARLMEAVRDHAARQGVDTLKVAVMTGNSRARRFYQDAGFEAGEEVLYHKI